MSFKFYFIISLIFQGLFLSATNNVIWRISTGKRTRHDDPELIELTGHVVNNFKNMDPSNPLTILQMASAPFAHLCNYLNIPNIIESSKMIKDKVTEAVTQSSPNENGNYIEKALSERENGIVTGNKTFLSGPYGKEYLRCQLMDLIVGGTDTTATTIEWIIMYLVTHQDCQQRMFEEINNITGDNARTIGLNDRGDAHYSNAFIDEVIRHSQLGFLPPPHKAMKDITFKGKHIPKGTQVLI